MQPEQSDKQFVQQCQTLAWLAILCWCLRCTTTHLCHCTKSFLLTATWHVCAWLFCLPAHFSTTLDSTWHQVCHASCIASNLGHLCPSFMISSVRCDVCGGVAIGCLRLAIDLKKIWQTRHQRSSTRSQRGGEWIVFRLLRLNFYQRLIKLRFTYARVIMIAWKIVRGACVHFINIFRS